MKQVCTLLMLMLPFLMFAQGKKEKKEKPSPEELAADYLKQCQTSMGFDSCYAVKFWEAGKDEDYPACTYQFVVNVTKNAGSRKNFEAYYATIKNTLLTMRRTYVCIVLDTASKKFQKLLEDRKCVVTKTFMDVDFGLKGEERMGQSLPGDTYKPGCRE